MQRGTVISGLRGRMYEFMKSHGLSSAQDLVREFGVDWRTAYDHLHTLCKEGYAERKGEKRGREVVYRAFVFDI